MDGFGQDACMCDSVDVISTRSMCLLNLTILLNILHDIL